MDERKQAGGQSARGEGARDGAGHELRRAGMGAVRLDHDGTARRERRGRVAAGDGEGEGKVAGAEDDHRPERNEHPAQIRTRQRLAIRERRINPRVDPRAFAHELREKPELPAGAAAFARDAGKGQAGF